MFTEPDLKSSGFGNVWPQPRQRGGVWASGSLPTTLSVAPAISADPPTQTWRTFLRNQAFGIDTIGLGEAGRLSDELLALVSAYVRVPRKCAMSEEKNIRSLKWQFCQISDRERRNDSGFCQSPQLRLALLLDRRPGQRRNGLLTRSTAIVLPGPWPQMKATSSPSGSSFSLIDEISRA